MCKYIHILDAQSISVEGPRYWPLALDTRMDSDCMRGLGEGRTLFVKRRYGYLDYHADPQGVHGGRG